MNSFISKMLRYKSWANERLFDTLKHLPSHVLTAPQKIKFGSLMATAQHVYEMDTVWQAHLMSSQHEINSRVPNHLLLVNELSDRQRKIDKWFETFANQCSTFEEPIFFKFIDGGRGKMTPLEMLLHLVNHGTYHRGHIAQMLYSSGVTPPATDFPVFIRDCGGDDLS